MKNPIPQDTRMFQPEIKRIEVTHVNLKSMNDNRALMTEDVADKMLEMFADMCLLVNEMKERNIKYENL